MIPFSEWLLQSFAVGTLAGACVWLCPARWRSRVRQAVPVGAFCALLLLGAGLLLPLPRYEIAGPAALSVLRESAPSAGWVLWLWAVGFALCALKLGVEFWAVNRIIRSSRPLPGRVWRQVLADCQRTLGLRGSVRLRLAGPGFVPSAAGLFIRTVLLPDEALRWTAEQRRLVLMHELGHFRRGDLWAHALGRMACAVHWFNPFAWMLQRHLAIEREFACDALVLARGAAPDDYATLLFEMATAARRRPACAAFLTMASPRTGKLEARVRRILEPVRRAGRFVQMCDGAVCALAVSALLLCVACKPVARVFSASQWTPAEIRAHFAADPFPGN